MTLRARIAVIAAVAVSVAVLLASTGLYLATARTLRGAVDRSLVELAHELRSPGPRGPRLFGPRPGHLGGAGGFVQYVSVGGRVLGAVDAEPLPVGDAITDVAAGRREAFFDTVEVDGQPIRILTVPVERGVAAQIARPLDEVGAALRTLRGQLAFGSLGGVALAAVLGTLVARRAMRPVDELTELAEDVATTQDLSRRIAIERDDEVGRLAATFNSMLANLEQARHAQEQPVADASHELRTPLTSLRTNIEVLADIDQLGTDDRRELIGDVVDQLDEFSQLIGALVELARGDRPAQVPEPLRLDVLVTDAVERARTHAGDARRITLRSAPTTVVGERDRLARAVSNLLDNALKYGGGGPVEASVADGRVTVGDRGPGIDRAHRDRVFDRFYRAPEARGVPGSGLGLAIVEQVAASHGGTVRAEDRPGGGTVFALDLPTTDGH